MIANWIGSSAVCSSSWGGRKPISYRQIAPRSRPPVIRETGLGFAGRAPEVSRPWPDLVGLDHTVVTASSKAPLAAQLPFSDGLNPAAARPPADHRHHHGDGVRHGRLASLADFRRNSCRRQDSCSRYDPGSVRYSQKPSS